MKPYLLASLLFCGAAVTAPVAARADVTVVATSEIADVIMPPQTMRFAPEDVPQEISDALQGLMKNGGPAVKRGRTEVLGWSGNGYKKSKAGEFKARVEQALTKGGWTYSEGEKLEGAQDATLVTAVRTTPTRKALIGIWAPVDNALVLAWTEMLPANAGGGKSAADAAKALADAVAGADSPQDDTPPQTSKPVSRPSAPTAPAAANVITVTDDQFVVNVAKGLAAPKVSFPALAVKPGKVRGYVKDAAGKPLKGAVIGVRSTAVGGAYSGASGKTDAAGYYEVTVPFGVASFYAAGYARDYNDSILALGLAPADGEVDGFASNVGLVENWVQLPYGIASRAEVQDNPRYLNNYYGGSVILEFRDENSGYGDQKGIPFGATVEVTLTPKGPLLDGGKGRTFTIRKLVKDGAQTRVYANNIPIGDYRLSARMIHNGATAALHLKEVGPDGRSPFGLTPKEADGAADLQFRPYGAKAEMVTAGKGNWKEVSVVITQ